MMSTDSRTEAGGSDLRLPPVAPIPPFVAAFIMRQVPSERWRLAIDGARATNPELAVQLAQAAAYLREGSIWWRDQVKAATSGSGNAEPDLAEAVTDLSGPDSSLDTTEAGRLLGDVSPRRVCQLIEDQKLRATRVGRRSWAIDRSSIEEYLMRKTA